MTPAALVVAAEEGEYNILLPAIYDIVWSLLIFGVIAGVLVWKVVPALTRILDERAERIEGGLKQAETAQAEAAQARTQIDAEIVAARREAVAIRERAQEDGKQIVADAQGKAQAEADRILAGAQRQIAAERQQAEIALKADVGALATTLASRIVGESLADEARRSRVVDRFLDELDQQAAPAPTGVRVAPATEA
ncbi:F0F1 ATP synthase subunit B [Georgenia faecalis]|uniref:ATP synthase subunit b n=1 Tax=Georgenia faecalis TaxID=2483799 RepID=A0ABV9DB04_9MICO|nr:F0F1 ATP synthase subunit B [Georgenia faecalis]